MNRKLLTSILLCAVFLLSMGTTFAMPSADAYETIVQSLPPLGARVTADSFPSFAEVVPNHPMVPPQVARGTYGGWEFMEQIQNGRISYVIIRPEAGEQDTTAIAEEILSATSEIYGDPYHCTDDGKYLWEHGVYDAKTGTFFAQNY